MRIICGSLLGSGFFACFCTAFGLDWSVGSALSGSPLKGLLSICNTIAEKLGRTDYTIIKRFADGFLEDGTSSPQGTALTILLIILMFLFVMIMMSGYRIMLLLSMVPPVGVMLATGVSPGPWATIAFAFATVCGLILMSERGSSFWILVLPAMALILTVGAGAVMDQGDGIAMGKIQKRSVYTLQGWAEKRYGVDPLGSGKLAVLDGKKLQQIRGTMESPADRFAEEDRTGTALEVEMETPRALYLRGFVGETYSNSRWTALDNAVYYDQRDQLYWLNRQGFDGLSQLSLADAISKSSADEEVEGKTTISIRVDEANRSNIYVPYELTGTEREIPNGMQNYAGGFLKSDRFMGSSSYEWNLARSLTSDWTDLAGRLFSSPQSSEMITYFENESRFNVWCYEQYTHIPDELRGLMDAAVGDPGDLSRNHADYKETIATVRDYLDENFIYTEAFEKPKEGEDAVEKFLVTGKGCDAHYASLASLLFRWFGIPARYVEGYLITPEDAEKAKATQTMTIGASHAHAWTEIYIDGLGWAPLEVTTSYRDIMPEADMEKGLEAVAYRNAPKGRKELPEEETTIESRTSEYGSLFLRILLAGGLILLLLLLIWILRRLIMKKIEKRSRLKAFADPDPRKGICAMYGYMLREGLPCREQAIEIGDLAAFSNDDIEEQQRSIMRAEIEWGEHEKRLLEKNTRPSPLDRLYDLWDGLRRR